MITIDIDPVVFASIRWYGIFLALAIAVIVVWAWRAAKRAGISEEVIYTGALYAIPAGIVVSRLLHLIDLQVTGRENYFVHPGRIIGLEGLTIFGAILGATLATWVYSRMKGLSFGRLVDLAAPGIVLGQAIGRVGCTINGCCYGTPTNLPWGFVYLHENSYAPLGVPFHPTTVYEIFCHLIIFGVLLGLRGRLKPDGSLFLIYFTLFSIVRFSLSFLRDGTAFLGGFQQAQIIALLVLAVTIPLLALKTRCLKPEASTTDTEG